MYGVRAPMGRPVFDQHISAASYVASDTINLELAPKPFTITRIGIFIDADLTTTTATNFNDYYDRLVATLSLNGDPGVGGSKTYFSFSDMRLPHHVFKRRGHGMKRPTVIADSQTNAKEQFGYLIHFGVAPRVIHPVTGAWIDNPFDLTAGIPPSSKGNLTLGGSWPAAAAVLGTNVTINTPTRLEVHLWGVRPDGMPDEAWMPRAFPNFAMRTITPTATSTPFQTVDNIPGGDYLHSYSLIAEVGTNAPRSSTMLTGLELWNELHGRSIWKSGGLLDAARVGASAELFGAPEYLGWPPDDPGGAGVPAITDGKEDGIYHIPAYQYARPDDPNDPKGIYGLDLTKISTGDLQARYGVATVSTVVLKALQCKYQLNPEHPLNARYL